VPGVPVLLVPKLCLEGISGKTLFPRSKRQGRAFAGHGKRSFPRSRSQTEFGTRWQWASIHGWSKKGSFPGVPVRHIVIPKRPKKPQAPRERCGSWGSSSRPIHEALSSFHLRRPVLMVTLFMPSSGNDTKKKIGPPMVDGLKALKHPDAKVRYGRFQTLVDLGPLAKFAAPELREMLTDKHPQVAVKAAEALWKIDMTPRRRSCQCFWKR